MISREEALRQCAQQLHRAQRDRADLLEALKELLDCPAGDYDTTDDYENAVKRARAAIARATGKQA